MNWIQSSRLRKREDSVEVCFCLDEPLQAPITTYKFSKLISMDFLQELVEREFDIGTKHFSFGDYVLFILTILFLDDELLMSGENQCWSVIGTLRVKRSQQSSIVYLTPKSARSSVQKVHFGWRTSVKIHQYPGKFPVLENDVLKTPSEYSDNDQFYRSSEYIM